MSTPAEHSHLGPSSWPIWTRCPAAAKVVDGMVDRPTFFAAEGTVFHEMVSDCLEFGFEPENFLGKALTVDGFTIEVDQEMVESARDGLDYLRFWEVQPGWKLWVETRVDISPWTLPGQFGTSDAVLANVSERKVKVWDWKYGQVPVYAPENRQCLGYLLGSWNTFLGPLFDWDPDDIEVEIIIEQPRVPGAGGTWKTTMSRALEFGAFARRQAQLTLRDDPPFVPGPVQCKYCKRRATCGARAKWFLETLGTDFAQIDDNSVMGAELGLPEEMTPERVSYVLDMAPLIRRWLDDLHARAYHQASQTGDFPGRKLVEGRKPPRKWREEDRHKAEVRLITALGRDKAFAEPKILTPSQAEKALGKTRYEETLARFVDAGSAKLDLVPEGDKRPAVRSAVDLFDAIDGADAEDGDDLI